MTQSGLLNWNVAAIVMAVIAVLAWPLAGWEADMGLVRTLWPSWMIALPIITSPFVYLLRTALPERP